MSGPKTGKFRLTAEHKLILKELREQQLQKEKECQQKSENSIREQESAVSAAQSGADTADAIRAGMSLNFDVLGQEYRYQIKAVLEETGNMDLSIQLREKEKKIKEKAADIVDEEFCKTYYSLTVLPFLKECRSYQQEEILRREQWLEREQEQAYINAMVDGAMEEMGYVLVGNRDIGPQGGKRFHSELYLLEEDTAVNVTFGEDGQITMELGKLDTVDRMPTAQESKEMCHDMDDFCHDFFLIREKLRQRGIIPAIQSMLPAEAQYARIINTSEYQMNEEAGNLKNAGRGKRKTEYREMREEK